MKFVTQDYYGILGVSPQAGPDDLKRAWRIARQSFRPDSPAVHSLYSPEEAEAIAGKIDEAYRILTDPEVARRYAKYHRTGRVGMAIPRDPDVFFTLVHEPMATGPLERLAQDTRANPASPRKASPTPLRSAPPPPDPRRLPAVGTPGAAIPVRRSAPGSRLTAIQGGLGGAAVPSRQASAELLIDALDEVCDDLPAPPPSDEVFEAERTQRILAALDEEDHDLEPLRVPVIAPALAAAALPRPPQSSAPYPRLAAATAAPRQAGTAPAPWGRPANPVRPTAVPVRPAAQLVASNRQLAPVAAHGLTPGAAESLARLPGASMLPPSPPTEGALAADAELRPRSWVRETIRTRAVGALDVTPLGKDDLAAIENECGGMGGAFLQTCRRQLGVAVEDIASRTKIMTQMIRWIEEDSLSNLPARVYLKGYLQQITRLLRLPPETVDGYLNHHRL